MKKVGIIGLLSLLLLSFSKNDKINNTNNTYIQKEIIMNDTIPKITGIGGVFFYSDNLKETKEWYTKNLGIEINDWGSSSFESRNINKPETLFNGNLLKKEMNIFHHHKKIL
jgi:hypothetical protein